MRIVTGRLISMMMVAVICCLSILWMQGVAFGNQSALAESKYPQVTAEELDKIYTDNEVAAEHKYGDKVIEVTGRVESVDKGWIYTYVDLAADAYGISTVRCRMKSDQMEVLASLWKGQKVVIRGTCTGKTLITVYLDDCIVTKKQKSK